MQSIIGFLFFTNLFSPFQIVTAGAPLWPQHDTGPDCDCHYRCTDVLQLTYGYICFDNLVFTDGALCWPQHGIRRMLFFLCFLPRHTTGLASHLPYGARDQIRIKKYFFVCEYNKMYQNTCYQHMIYSLKSSCI